MAARVTSERCDFSQTKGFEDPFVESFFSLSKKCEEESSDPEIISLLKELSALGYTLSKKSVVYGNQLGKYWPCLEKEGSFCAVGSAIGSRGGYGLGRESLKEYLQCRKQMVVTNQVQQKNLPQESSSSSSSSSLSERSVQKQSAPSSSSAPKPASADDIMRAFSGFGGISFSGALPFQLKNFQSMGYFSELPEKELNALTVDDVLGASISLYRGGYCLLEKNKEILAHTPGLVIKKPSFEFLGTKMYDKLMNGKWVSIDDPCDLPREIQTELKDASALEEMIPYFRGLVLYQKG